MHTNIPAEEESCPSAQLTLFSIIRYSLITFILHFLSPPLPLPLLFTAGTLFEKKKRLFWTHLRIKTDRLSSIVVAWTKAKSYLRNRLTFWSAQRAHRARLCVCVFFVQAFQTQYVTRQCAIYSISVFSRVSLQYTMRTHLATQMLLSNASDKKWAILSQTEMRTLQNAYSHGTRMMKLCNYLITDAAGSGFKLCTRMGWSND